MCKPYSRIGMEKVTIIVSHSAHLPLRREILPIDLLSLKLIGLSLKPLFTRRFTQLNN